MDEFVCLFARVTTSLSSLITRAIKHPHCWRDSSSSTWQAGGYLVVGIFSFEVASKMGTKDPLTLLHEFRVIRDTNTDLYLKSGRIQNHDGKNLTSLFPLVSHLMTRKRIPNAPCTPYACMRQWLRVSSQSVMNDFLWLSCSVFPSLFPYTSHEDGSSLGNDQVIAGFFRHERKRGIHWCATRDDDPKQLIPCSSSASSAGEVSDFLSLIVYCSIIITEDGRWSSAMTNFRFGADKCVLRPDAATAAPDVRLQLSL